MGRQETFHHQGSTLLKGDLLIRGVPLTGRVERGFGFACLFYKSFEKLWLPLKFRGRAAKISKRKKTFMGFESSPALLQTGLLIVEHFNCRNSDY